MKKSLIALAVMAAAGAASAQSAVTLFGIVDATLNWNRGSGAGSTDNFVVGTSGYNSSRIGFRGTEDLGGGMSASFWLEAGFQADNGGGYPTNTNNTFTGVTVGGAGQQGLTFFRRSTVSLAGRWGELRLGRDYSPTYWNLTVFDPFGSVGVGASQTMISAALASPGFVFGPIVRTSNNIGYHAPANLGGFYGQVNYWTGEGGAATDDGDGYGARIGFASGPFNVALGYSRTEHVGGDLRYMNLGGQWDFGMAKLMGQISRDEILDTDGRGWLLGALVPLGAGEFRVAYSRYRLGGPSARKLAVGYVHNLSKRTALYTTFAILRNRGGSAIVVNPISGALVGPNGNSRGLDVGIRHAF